MRNLGPRSRSWLAAAGLHTLNDLQQTGPAEAYVLLEQLGFQPSLNLLWAMEGALTDLDWREVPLERKHELQGQLQKLRTP